VDSAERRTGVKITTKLLEVSADDFDDVLGRFRGSFGFAGHVIENVILHEFRHKAVDGAASGSEALKDIGAMSVFLQGVEHGLQLADKFFGTSDKVEMFAS
jgi:hypothetical protein